MSDPTDRSRPVRAGEELDAAALETFLRERVPSLFEGATGAGGVAIEQFPSGHSNLTYLVRVGDRELVLRRPPFGSRVKSAHDMGREVRVLEKLCVVYPPAPRPVAYCEDASVLGAPFYLMERVRGIVLRRALPKGLDLAPQTVRRLGEAFTDNLAALHAIDPVAAGLGDLGKPVGYVARQVTGWTKRWHDSKTDEVPDVDRIGEWLAARIPAETGAAIIHNDYKYDNLVLDASDPTRIVGVLDWEMATLGDPLMDLGTALGYWVEAADPEEIKSFAFGPTFLPGSLTRTEITARYGERTGRDVSDMLFYFCFALFKTAVVAQQIYYRYKQGLTKDDRFAAMIFGVRLLSQAAVRAAEAGRISPG